MKRRKPWRKKRAPNPYALMFLVSCLEERRNKERQEELDSLRDTFHIR